MVYEHKTVPHRYMSLTFDHTYYRERVNFGANAINELQCYQEKHKVEMYC